MPVDTYLVLTPSPGSPPISTDPVKDKYFKTTFPDAPVVEIRQFSFGAENPVSVGSAGGGAGAGKARLNELVIEKSVDRLSGALFAMSATGGHLARVQLYVRKSGGDDRKPYLVYGFDMVFVSRIDWSGGGGEEEPLERVTFAYGALALGYYPRKPDGTFDAPLKTGWSQVTNTEAPSELLTGF